MKQGGQKTQIFDKPFDMDLLDKYRTPLYLSEIEKDVKSSKWQHIKRATLRLYKINLIQKTEPIRKKKQKFVITDIGKKLLEVYKQIVIYRNIMNKIITNSEPDGSTHNKLKA